MSSSPGRYYKLRNHFPEHTVDLQNTTISDECAIAAEILFTEGDQLSIHPCVDWFGKYLRTNNRIGVPIMEVKL